MIMEAVRNFKKNWLVLVAVAVLAVVGGMASSTINSRNMKVDGAASVEYVDKENLEQDAFHAGVNARQDRELLYLNENKADIKEVNSIHEDVREMRETQVEMFKILIELKDK